jgi:hypothetical protein
MLRLPVDVIAFKICPRLSHAGGCVFPRSPYRQEFSWKDKQQVDCPPDYRQFKLQRSFLVLQPNPKKQIVITIRITLRSMPSDKTIRMFMFQTS